MLKNQLIPFIIISEAEVVAIDFKLQGFELPMIVTGIANIHYFEFTKEYHTIENHHNFCELLFVDNGEIEVTSENFKGVLSVNELIIHQPNEKHSLKGYGDTAPNIIIIGFECDCPKLLEFSKSPITLSTEHKRILSKIMQEGMSIYEPPYDIPNTTYMKKRKEYPFGADQMIKNTLEAFLIMLVRDFLYSESNKDNSGSEIENNMKNVYQYISEHYSENITLDNLCFIFGTNKTSLCRDFKKSYGLTILEHVHVLRIDKAKKLLRQNDLSVTEISDMLGFVSVHYFCRLFKKRTGLSPTMYQKSVKAKLSL